ncbi:hypothetical protein [Flavobacterium sp. AJR]|uniref:hypothetical protein n=1 Tax=Flavobacterium sp. AJR TaxID=1979369 RepID=UPI000F50E34A|nr:hypothetical protein [Flavobacterium sp. AJR]
MGEIVVIYIHGGTNYYDVKMELVDVFTGKTKNDNVNVFQPLTFVKHFKESKFRRLFCPVSVAEYLRKNAELKNNFASKIYETKWITKRIKVNTLAGNPRKLLSLYSTLSKTNNIVFDLAGQDPQGASEAYQIIKDEIRNGGSAILVDWKDDMRNDCSKFITIEWQ